jgi:hypothetical protein
MAMNPVRWLALAGFVAVVGGVGAWAAEGKGTVVDLGGLKSTAPAAWKEETAGKMRAYQFKIPRAKEDPADAEMIVFYFGPGGGGSTKDNIKRWKGFFEPPSGKSIDDVAKVEELKVAGKDVTYLDVAGTYLYKAAPFDPNAKVEKKPDYRMIGVVFETDKGAYFLRLVGPAKTVGDNKKGFDEWLKAFK